MNDTKKKPGFEPRRVRPYPKYKDSGIEWLGKIPKHWEAFSLKRIGDLQAGAGFPDNEQGLTTEEVPFFKVGDMGMPGNEREMQECQHTVSKSTARRLRAFIFPTKTIVFAKVGAALLLNRRRLLNRPSCIDNNMMGFMPDKCDPTWAMYWLIGLDLGELANPGAVPSVNEGQMRDTPIALPPEPEQRAIAAFLDRETAKIDALIEKKERLVELLLEKRTALITQAVTKGLDPTVPMKDSGIEWLGKIPKHWEVKRLKHLSALNPEALPEDTDPTLEMIYVDIGGINSLGQIIESAQLTFASAPSRARRIVRDGDVVVSTVRTYLRAIAPINNPATSMVVSTGFAVVRPQEELKTDFAAYALRAPYFVERVVSNSKGVSFPAINECEMATFELTVPPEAEQRAIAVFLDHETTKTDALILKIREAVAHLKEYRTALISAAVTGKIDVREKAPSESVANSY